MQIIGIETFPVLTPPPHRGGTNWMFLRLDSESDRATKAFRQGRTPSADRSPLPSPRQAAGRSGHDCALVHDIERFARDRSLRLGLLAPDVRRRHVVRSTSGSAARAVANGSDMGRSGPYDTTTIHEQEGSPATRISSCPLRSATRLSLSNRVDDLHRSVPNGLPYATRSGRSFGHLAPSGAGAAGATRSGGTEPGLCLLTETSGPAPELLRGDSEGLERCVTAEVLIAGLGHEITITNVGARLQRIEPLRVEHEDHARISPLGVV